MTTKVGNGHASIAEQAAKLEGKVLKALQVGPTFVPVITTAVLVAGWDPEDGNYRALNLDTLRQLQVLAEQENILGIVDERDGVTATIGAGAAIGAVASEQIEVPAGEVWYLAFVEAISPAESGVGVGDIVQVNLRCSVWPDTAATPDADGQLFWPTNQGTVALDNFFAEFHPGAPFFNLRGKSKLLRLPPGATLTLEAVLVGAGAGANLTASLNPYGFRGKVLID